MMHPWHLHGMPMQVVARDGYPLGSAAFTCDTLGVNPGERWDVVIECDEPGAWAFHCHILPHAEGADGMYGMVTALVVQDATAAADLAAAGAPAYRCVDPEQGLGDGVAGRPAISISAVRSGRARSRPARRRAARRRGSARWSRAPSPESAG